MVYPGHEMIRFATIQGMYNRTITIGSAGKAFSATGWKLGWWAIRTIVGTLNNSNRSIAPKWLLEPLKRVHENCIFAASAPTQEALARAFEVQFLNLTFQTSLHLIILGRVWSDGKEQLIWKLFD